MHVGHLRMFKEAAKYSDLVVIVNSDEWLTRKKGKPFMVYDDRAEIISELKCVSAVVEADDDDGTVCTTLDRLRPDCFANGGDRTKHNTPEGELCQKLGIKQLFNIGGEKIRSSSELCR